MTAPAPTATNVWRETRLIPDVLQRTLDAADGVADVLALLRDPGARRLIITGNGASSYVAHGAWLTALAGPAAPVQVVGVPAGLLATGDLRLGDGDVLLAISASGELRDLVELLDDRPAGLKVAAITGTPDSTIGREADARALVAKGPQEAVTHTHAFCGAVTVAAQLIAELSDDKTLLDAVHALPEAAARAVDAAEAWGAEAVAGIDVPAAVFAFGTGAGWAAALEAALVVKEICQIPAEGVETREAATTAMTTLLPEHLLLDLAPSEDPVAAESRRICGSRGAAVLRAPGADFSDNRLSPVTTFPAAVALAAELAVRVGRDADQPAWTATYYETARKG